MKYTIPTETKDKLKQVKTNSKYYLTASDEKNNYYVVLTADDNEKIKIPFKAMFFKDVNSKLSKIISISNSSTHCSSHRLGYYQLKNPSNECYGLKTEKQYARKDIINSYESNLISGLILNAANITYLSKYINNVLKPEYIRFNKHGDFINHQQFLKFLNLTQKTKNVIYYGYTARDDLIKDYNITYDFLTATHPNLIINGSNNKIINRFKVTYNLEEYTRSRYTCKGNCLNCKQCINLKNKTITALYHGSNSETVLNTAENRTFIGELLEALNVDAINPDELKGGKLFDKINKTYKHYYNIDLKNFNQKNTKEFLDNLIITAKDLKNTGAIYDQEYLKNKGVI